MKDNNHIESLANMLISQYGDDAITLAMLRAAEFAAEMLNNGVYVIAFSYPVVAKGMARIRTQMSASFSKEENIISTGKLRCTGPG